MISAGAKVLGSFKIGDNSKIGSGSVVLQEVPPNSTVVGVPGRVVERKKKTAPQETMDQCNLPNPVEEDLRKLQQENEQMARRIYALEEEMNYRKSVKKSGKTAVKPTALENGKSQKQNPDVKIDNINVFIRERSKMNHRKRKVSGRK